MKDEQKILGKVREGKEKETKTGKNEEFISEKEGGKWQEEEEMKDGGRYTSKRWGRERISKREEGIHIG